MSTQTKDRLCFAIFVLVAALCVARKCCGAEARLNIQPRGSDAVVFVTDGTSNVQYQVWTSNDHTINSTNWFPWRRAYSVTFLANTNSGEMLVYSPASPPGAAARQPQRFFQIRGVLPD